MRKIRGTFTNLFGLMIYIYAIGATISPPYFMYRDIKDHDSFLRYFFVSPLVGALKGTVWPYYAIRPTPAQISSASVDAFFQALKNTQVTNRLGLELRTANDPSKAREIFEKMKGLTDATAKVLTACNESELEGIYPGWGKGVALFKDSLKKANLYMTNQTSEAETAESEKLFMDFQLWLSENMEALSLKLDEEGYSVKKPRDMSESMAANI